MASVSIALNGLKRLLRLLVVYSMDTMGTPMFGSRRSRGLSEFHTTTTYGRKPSIDFISVKYT